MSNTVAISKDEWDLLVELYVDDMGVILKRVHPQARKKSISNGRSLLSKQECDSVDSFKYFTEITDSLQSLELILILAKRKPPQNRAEPMKVLRFYIEAYLQEIYILRERLIRWLRFEKRLASHHSKEGLYIKNLEAIVRASFEGPNTLRSAHVHEARHDTNDLSWASTLELIAHNRPAKETVKGMAWRMAADLKYKECRAEFIKSKTEERKEIQKLLNALASVAQPIVQQRHKSLSVI